LKARITEDGVWRIRRKERSSTIEIFMVEETGHGDVLSDEFINWRIKLALNTKEVVGTAVGPTIDEGLGATTS
jgi:RAT1-interacting protein